MTDSYCRVPCDFLLALRQARVSQLGFELILYILSLTYKRWIRHKSLESCGLDWIDFKQREINRACWGKNSTVEINRSLDNLLPKEIVVIDSQVKKIRINYNYETWSI